MNPIKLKHKLFFMKIEINHNKSFLFRFIYKRYNKMRHVDYNYLSVYENKQNDTLTINLFDLELNITFPWHINYIEKDDDDGFASEEKCYGIIVKNTYRRDHIFYLTSPNNFFRLLNKIIPDSYLIFFNDRVYTFDAPLCPQIHKTIFYDNSCNKYKSRDEIPEDKKFKPIPYTYIYDNGDIIQTMIKYDIISVVRKPKCMSWQNIFSFSTTILVIIFPDGLPIFRDSSKRVYSYDLIMRPGELPIEAIHRVEREKRWK